jgi:hypothetical protein
MQGQWKLTAYKLLFLLPVDYNISPFKIVNFSHFKAWSSDASEITETSIFVTKINDCLGNLLIHFTVPHKDCPNDWADEQNCKL